MKTGNNILQRTENANFLAKIFCRDLYLMGMEFNEIKKKTSLNKNTTNLHRSKILFKQ